VIGGTRLELAASQHQRDLTAERRQARRDLAAAASVEEGELAARLSAATALRAQLAQELAAAQSELAALPEPPDRLEVQVDDEVRDSRPQAEAARRAAVEAAAMLSSQRTRRQFLEEARDRQLAQVRAARSKLPAAETAAAKTAAAAAASAQAESELLRKRAELAGLEALRPGSTGDLPRLVDLITAKPGYEAALAAALGPLLDAEVASDQQAALSAAPTSGPQRTVLFSVPEPDPDPDPDPVPRSLLEHVHCRRGHERLARRLLGQIVLGEGPGLNVTLEGEYREAGLVRRGHDPRAELAARRRDLIERIGELEPLAGESGARHRRAQEAEAALAGLRAVLAQEAALEEAARQLAALVAEDAGQAARLETLEAAATEAETHATELGRMADKRERMLAEHSAAVARLELERERWRDRSGDLRRQADAVAADLAGLDLARQERAKRVAVAKSEADALEERLIGLEAEVGEIGARLAAAEADSPEEEAELAEAARRLLAVEEARVDCRLRVTTLEGNLALAARDAELAQARMDDIRSRLPEGLAPEEVPGGKAREREIRALERRLEEIGPTNPLAVAECEELEARHSTLEAQLEDIAAARSDLGELIDRLRSEEESRYEAVFGAVAVNFQELFERLSPGGRATLRHAAGEDGPWSGVEILVQPPRKRLQRVTLLSSGERSLAALALVLALEAVNPSPFVILDEVDAALDDANVGRFAELVAELGQSRQFLVITHNHVTMAGAGALYGIHLDESGSSHVVSVLLEEVRRTQRRPAATA
jgi:chromosome segregation protein